MVNKNYCGFKPFYLKYSDNSVSKHCLFIKQHNVREKNDLKPPNRTLFVLNAPSYCTEENFKRVFGTFGNVTSVYFHKTPNANLPPKETSSFFFKYKAIKEFKVAYIVFESESGLKEALEWEGDEPLVLSSKELPTFSGLRKWCAEYNNQIPNPQCMQKEIDAFMESFDQESTKKSCQEKESMEADEEGWVTVTKKGKKPGFSRKESIEKKILAKEKLKRSKKELLNFYTFQIRESKMKHLAKMRQKFEEDKKRINLLKQSRKFKPF